MGEIKLRGGVMESLGTVWGGGGDELFSFPWLTLHCEISPYHNNRAAPLKEVPWTDKPRAGGRSGVAMAMPVNREVVRGGRQSEGWERKRERERKKEREGDRETERLCVLVSLRERAGSSVQRGLRAGSQEEAWVPLLLSLLRWVHSFPWD